MIHTITQTLMACLLATVLYCIITQGKKRIEKETIILFMLASALALASMNI